MGLAHSKEEPREEGLVTEASDSLAHIPLPHRRPEVCLQHLMGYFQPGRVTQWAAVCSLTAFCVSRDRKWDPEIR